MPSPLLCPRNLLSLIFQCTLDSSQRQIQNIPHFILFNLKNLLGKHRKKRKEKKKKPWAWEMDQSAKCLLCKHKDINLDAQHPCTRPDMAACTCNAGAVDAEQGGPGACCSDSPAGLVSFRQGRECASTDKVKSD